MPAARMARCSPAVPLDTARRVRDSEPAARSRSSNSPSRGPSASRPERSVSSTSSSSRSPTSGRASGITSDARAARAARRCCARPGSMPASSESTSASQLASMMFSDTPIAPQVSVPSLASSSTRVTAPVPLRLVEDAHLEVDELDVAQVRVALADRLAQRLVERVHRAVALGRAHVALAVDPDLDRRLGLDAAVLALLDDHAPRLEPEQRLVVARLLADQQVERAVGRLELVAAVLQLLDALDHARGGRRRPRRRAPATVPLPDSSETSTRAVGADVGRVDVLERAGVAVDAGHVHAALVGEGVGAHVGLVRVRRDVAELVDQVRDLGQAPQPVARRCTRSPSSARGSGRS